MPEFVRPRRAIIETGGGAQQIVMLAAVCAVLAVVVSLVLFVAAHIVLVAWCVAGAVAVMGTVVAWMVWVSSPKRLQRAGVLPSQQAAAVSQPAASPRTLPRPAAARALPPAQHLHLHFHGVTADDAAAITQATRKDAK